jgi:ABC-2 type transport system ATP-binding protein
MPEPVLRARGLSKSFGRRPALEAVSLDVEAGEFLGLVGPNGAGKTTLLSIAAGLLVADRGTLSLFGLTYSSDRSRILSQLGVVFQSRALDLEITGAAALRFQGAMFGLSGRELNSRIEEIGTLLEITDLLSRRIGNLSGGNVRRLEIGRALINRPRLVLMDEASAGLDPIIRERLLAHVRAVCRTSGVAVVWSTHLLDEVVGADRVVIIHEGKVRGMEEPHTDARGLLEVYADITR